MFSAAMNFMDITLSLQKIIIFCQHVMFYLQCSGGKTVRIHGLKNTMVIIIVVDFFILKDYKLILLGSLLRRGELQSSKAIVPPSVTGICVGSRHHLVIAKIVHIVEESRPP